MFPVVPKNYLYIGNKQTLQPQGFEHIFSICSQCSQVKIRESFFDRITANNNFTTVIYLTIHKISPPLQHFAPLA